MSVKFNSKSELKYPENSAKTTDNRRGQSFTNIVFKQNKIKTGVVSPRIARFNQEQRL